MNRPSWDGKLRPNARSDFLAYGVFSLLTAIVLMGLLAILTIILSRGLQQFWPAELASVTFTEAGKDRVAFMQVIARGSANEPWLLSDPNSGAAGVRLERVASEHLTHIETSPDIARIVLTDGSVQLAKIVSVSSPSRQGMPAGVLNLILEDVRKIRADIASILNGPMADLHDQLQDVESNVAVNSDADTEQRLEEYYRLDRDAELLKGALEVYQLSVAGANGDRRWLNLSEVEGVTFPNQYSGIDKTAVFSRNLWRFVAEGPKRNNQTGGVFPALFGTVVMVLLMTLLVTPVGVVVAVYLSEYAAHNSLTAFIRICVNNLAGVPSVVYGVFGLGFFVYAVGGDIDALFYADALPSPTFGAPGLFWASLTMALLTLPVVIVATEEGLRRVPKDLRMGSYALGATKYETLTRTVLPIASPGIMTGVILAIARGAGEVAPLILVGAVKFAPQLPIDGTFPFIHLERPFMHLGVLIYDGAYLGDAPGQGSPFMYATCSLLLLLVLCLNLVAIAIRAKLRKRYQSLSGAEID